MAREKGISGESRIIIEREYLYHIIDSGMWEIIGHQKQIQYLENDISYQTVKHAYLFTGPDKIGKFTLVRRFAKLLQCHHAGCNNCPDCHQIDAMTHPDTIMLRDRGESVKVDEIRDIVQRTNKTYQSRFFIICIENIERMTEETSNAFLKTLEEPPPGVIFLLTTVHSNRVLPTVLSRVFIMELGGVKRQELQAYLVQKFQKEEIETIEKVINLAANKPGLAIEMLQDRNLFDYYLQLYNSARRLLEKASVSERMLFVDHFLQQYKDDPVVQKQEVAKMLEFLLYLLRGVFSHRILGQEYSIMYNASLSDILMRMEKIQQAMQWMDKNINRKIVLENLMLSL